MSAEEPPPERPSRIEEILLMESTGSDSQRLAFSLADVQCDSSDAILVKDPEHPAKRKKRVIRAGSQVFLPRLIPRNFAFKQSYNRVQVANKNIRRSWKLLSKDWFHGDPGTPITFPTAFAFSLETCTTVGYGLPGSTNAFFESGCRGLQVAIFFQMVFSLLFNGFFLAFIYSQMSKSELRATQVLFSDKLCILVNDGKVYASVRCYDLDSSYPLVEAHARMYVLDHRMKLHPLRLTDPKDDLGGMMYPSIPQDLLHHIDHHSALGPRRMPLVEGDHCLVLRTIDSATCNREEISCPVCGEAYGTYERLLRHVKYAQIVERKDDYPVESSHLGFKMPDISPITVDEVRRHIERTLSENIVVVEAIDPQFSGTFQAVQSYKYDNIEFNCRFK